MKATTKSQSKTKKATHHIYVVELHKKVWTESKNFRDANGHFKGLRECLYVGISSHSPQERFHKHKTGYRNKKGIKISSWFVEKYGKFLRPSLYEAFNPLPKSKAVRLEKELSESLRKRGYAVWWN